MEISAGWLEEPMPAFRSSRLARGPQDPSTLGNTAGVGEATPQVNHGPAIHADSGGAGARLCPDNFGERVLYRGEPCRVAGELDRVPQPGLGQCCPARPARMSLVVLAAAARAIGAAASFAGAVASWLASRASRITSAVAAPNPAMAAAVGARRGRWGSQRVSRPVAARVVFTVPPGQ